MSEARYTLSEAAAQLGKSERQVRYMIRQGDLKALKVSGRWYVPAEAIEKTPARTARRQPKAEALRAAVDQALDAVAPAHAKPWTVRNIRAIQHAVALHGRLSSAFGADSPPAQQMAHALSHLVRGGYAFDRADKRACYQQARLTACDLLATLLLKTDDPAPELIEAIERDLMPTLVGLLRKTERASRRGVTLN